MLRPTLLAAALLLASCNTFEPDAPRAPSAPARVELARLDTIHGAYEWNSGILTPEAGVIRSASEWDSVYARIGGRYLPPPTKGPSLNFRDSLLIYAAYGEFPYGAVQILVDSAIQSGDAIFVYYSAINWDSPGCGFTQAVVAPVDVVQMARTDRVIILRGQQVQRPCGV